jgi:hypothetical protein
MTDNINKKSTEKKKQSEMPVLVLDSFDTYTETSLAHLKWQLEIFFGDISTLDAAQVQEKIKELNAYENIGYLKPLEEEHVVILDEEKINTTEAEQVVLNGEFFWEHAAAGEATRLGLGTKYLLDLSKFTIEKIIELRKAEIEKDFKDAPEKKKELLKELNYHALLTQMGCKPSDLLPLNLGTRHMLQMVFDIKKLAKKHALDFHEVMKKQKTLIVLNEEAADEIINSWVTSRFFGFDCKNVFFMVQKSFHGIELKKGNLFYDKSHEKHKRLHNHGQMVMQKTQDKAIFTISQKGEKRYLNSKEFEKVLITAKDLLSYNVEDIDYLTGAVDWHSLALALDLGKKGYGMVMEVVAQNPHKPQVGGACFWDAKLERVVMIELNQLKGMTPGDIQHLNKNFNHYPNPVVSFRAVKAGKMHLHSDVKKSVDAEGNEKYYIYFCTPQGDINFHVKTAYVMRKNLKPISNWKSPATTPPAIKACYQQDKQPGFKEFAEDLLGRKL